MTLYLKSKTYPNFTIPQLFDRALYRKRRQQLASNSVYFNFAAEISKRLIDRLSYFNYDFHNAFQMGNDQGLLQNYLTSFKKTDIFLQGEQTLSLVSSKSFNIICDEENLPLACNTFDLLIHFLNLQAVNDVPGVLSQSLNCLKPDGLLIAALFGGDSFMELKTILEEVELQHYKGVSQRVSPWIRPKDAGALLQRAGFALPIADCDRLTFIYPNLRQLLKDLKEAKATSFLYNNQHPSITKNLLNKAEQLYKEKFWDNVHQGIKVSIDIIFMTGWRPSNRQQKALKPGSAEYQLSDFLER